MQQRSASHVTYFQYLKPYRLFLSLLCCCWTIALYFSFTNTQAELFLAVNRLHNPLADQFFMGLTVVGDWPFTTLLALLGLFLRFRYSFVLIGSMLYTGIYTQALKFMLHHPRPSLYFEHLEPIYTIKNYAVSNDLSFPSGHTTCVFALGITLCYLSKAKAQLAFFMLALFVSISRVYLSQHFFKDIMAGALIGTFFSLHLIWILEKRSWYKNPTLNRNLLSLTKRNKNTL